MNKNIESEENRRSSRRKFIKLAGGAIALTVVTPALLDSLTKPKPAYAGSSVAQPIETGLHDDVLLRMQQELNLAVSKPVEERSWHMVIDLRKCSGCLACTVACISENKLPPGVVYRPVLDEEIGRYPNVTRRFTPRPCMQCGNPPCVTVCPVGATWKTADGVIVIDYRQCIGCRYCITACPYSARTADFGEVYSRGTPEATGLIVGKAQAEVYERISNFEYGSRWPRHRKTDSPIGNARKCHFCLHRLENGMLPACVTTCIGRATYFGDANDPQSTVAKLIGSPNAIRLKEEMGTDPRVHYLL